MADSLCGPSNALQSFQKHSTVDRTLQQDRLTSRQSPSQGFRSSPGANAGLLDAEFGAFQAGQLPLDQGFQQHGFSHPSQSLQQPGNSAWASDFSRMQISSPPPQYQQPSYGYSGGAADFRRQQQMSSPQSPQQWEQEFAQQQGQAGGSSMIQGHSQTSSLFRPMGGMNMTPQYMGGFAGTQAGMPMQQQNQQQQPAEAFDEEAFARAFEEASKSDVDTQQETNQEQNVGLGQDILINETAERFMADSDGLLDQDRIGADTIHDPLSQTPEAREQQDDPDALARQAGQLLHSVRNNQTDKFQKSTFLDLMRQLRDKDAVVSGDQVVNVRAGQEAIQREITVLLDALITYTLPGALQLPPSDHARAQFYFLFGISNRASQLDPRSFADFTAPKQHLAQLIARNTFVQHQSVQAQAQYTLYTLSPRSSDGEAFPIFREIRTANAEYACPGMFAPGEGFNVTRLFEYLYDDGYVMLERPSPETLHIHLQRAEDFFGESVVHS